MGERRTRGLGLVKIRVEDEIHLNNKNLSHKIYVNYMKKQDSISCYTKSSDEMPKFRGKPDKKS